MYVARKKNKKRRLPLRLKVIITIAVVKKNGTASTNPFVPTRRTMVSA